MTLAVVLIAAGTGMACDESLQGVEPRTGEAIDARIVAVGGQQLLAQFGVRLDTPLRVRVLDSDGRPVRSAGVRYAVLGGSGLFSAERTVTNDQGFTEVLFRPTTTGTVIVEARVEGARDGDDRVQFTIQVLSDPNVAASFERVAGSGQSAPLGSVLPQPLEVLVENGDGVPVDSFPVTFALETSQGNSAGVAERPDGPFARQATVTTDANGIARVFALLGSREGDHSYTATAVTADGTETLTFTATATPSSNLALLVPISGQSQTVVIDTLNQPGSPDFQGRDPNPFVAQAVDAFGNPVAGITVTWFVSDGGGAVTSAVTTTDAAGIATTRLVGPTEGTNEVVALAPGVAPVTFTVEAEVFVPAPDEGGGGGGGG